MIIEAIRRPRAPAGRATTLIVRETRREDNVVAVGLILGILGLLIGVAAAIGSISIGWT